MISIEQIINEKILALSWWEPFGSLMLYGKTETRDWSTNYRGLVLICTTKIGCANKKLFEIAGKEQYERILGALSVLDAKHNIKVNHGHAIAVGRLVDCRPMTKKDEDYCFIQYFPGKWCHVYKDVTPIVPFPWKGNQKWSTVPDSIKQQISFIN